MDAWKRLNMIRSHPIDRYVGQKVRVARLSKGLSQTRLGEAVGLTFQQIQKYEKGTNRISASRLYQFSEILGVDILYFFEGAGEQSQPDTTLSPSVSTPSLSRLDVGIMQGLAEIKDPRLKRKILDLIGYLASARGDTEPGGAPVATDDFSARAN
jgi:transcriptional regulator with XRE-family HTH domain